MSDFSSYDSRGEEGANPEAALEFLGKHCKWAVVTLGPNGCIVKHGKEVSDRLIVLKHCKSALVISHCKYFS